MQVDSPQSTALQILVVPIPLFPLLFKYLCQQGEKQKLLLAAEVIFHLQHPYTHTQPEILFHGLA